MTIHRRTLGGLALTALASPALIPSARAQNRSITMIVPYAAGGGTDIIGRAFADAFQQELGQTVVVDNRGGAAGHIGSLAVARARPDGSTLLCAVSTNVVINPHIQRGEFVDLANILVPVSQISSYQYVLVIDPKVPANNVAELVALGKKPGANLTFSSSGVGGNNHLAGLIFSEAAGLDMVHIPYRGTAPALMDVVAGRITMNFSSPPPAMALVKEGKLRALAVTGTKRISTLPDVPTMVEAGFPNGVVLGWHGIFAPPGTPAEVVARYEAAAKKAAANPKYLNHLATDGLDPAPDRPREAFAQAVKDESAYWAKKSKELNITAD
jgi:tripartite-type tricarboxylate transporter receptor subunit TctC